MCALKHNECVKCVRVFRVSLFVFVSLCIEIRMQRCYSYTRFVSRIRFQSIFRTSMAENPVSLQNTKAQILLYAKICFWLLDIHRLCCSKILKVKTKKTSCVVEYQIKYQFIFLPLQLWNLTISDPLNKRLIELCRSIFSRKYFIIRFLKNIMSSEIVVIEHDGFQESFLKM